MTYIHTHLDPLRRPDLQLVLSLQHRYKLLILQDAAKIKGNLWRWLQTPSWRL